MTGSTDFNAGREVCPQCGRDAYGTWCECGFELTSVDRLPSRAEYEAAEPASGPAGSSQQPTPPPAGSRRWIIIAAVIVMVIGVAVAILLIAVAEPTMTSGP